MAKFFGIDQNIISKSTTKISSLLAKILWIKALNQASDLIKQKDII